MQTIKTEINSIVLQYDEGEDNSSIVIEIKRLEDELLDKLYTVKQFVLDGINNKDG